MSVSLFSPFQSHNTIWLLTMWISSRTVFTTWMSSQLLRRCSKQNSHAGRLSIFPDSGRSMTQGWKVDFSLSFKSLVSMAGSHHVCNALLFCLGCNSASVALLLHAVVQTQAFVDFLNYPILSLLSRSCMWLPDICPPSARF